MRSNTTFARYLDNSLPDTESYVHGMKQWFPEDYTRAEGKKGRKYLRFSKFLQEQNKHKSINRWVNRTGDLT